MTYSRSARDRLLRLVGDGKSGGGVNLSLLFATLLDRLQDDGRLTVSGGLQAIEVPLGNQFSRIQHLYGGSGSAGDAMAEFMTDCLEQLEYQGIAQRDGHSWVSGPRYQVGVRMIVIGTFDGRKIDVGHTVVPREDRDRVSSQQDLPSRIREDVARLAQLLEPTAVGLRPIRQGTIDSLRDSVQRWGIRPEFPVLRDQHGRILSGRHRLEVARQLNTTWPVQVIEVRDDREAIEIALAANFGRSWSSDDIKRLEASGLRSTHRKTAERLVQLVLLGNPNRSNHAIARLVGCDDDTVAMVRRALEDTSEIPKVTLRHVRSGTPASRGELAIGGQMKTVVDLVIAKDGLTADEIQALTEMPRQSVSATCTNAAKLGLLVRTAEKRRMRNGRMAYVYRPTDKAIATSSASTGASSDPHATSSAQLSV